MKNIFNFLNYENLKKIIERIISRFPIAFLIVIITCVLFFVTIHGTFEKEFINNLYKIIFSLVITYFFSVGIHISSENLGFTKIKQFYLQAIPLLFGIIFFIGFKKDFGDSQNIIYVILTLVGIISYIFIAPYIKQIFKNIDQNLYYKYFYKISLVFQTSTVFGLVLFILGNIGIFSVISLFDLNHLETDKIVADWAVISLSFFAPLFALNQIPEKDDISENGDLTDVFFSFLTKYIGIPFVFVYFLILYAYSIKVLFNFSDWPKGEVSWLVIGFSIFGYLAYIFSYAFENNYKFINFFRKIFPFAVIPQVFMLFYAIWLRINQYDLTTNRYFVVVFGVWLLIISIYFIISKRKSLIYIPSILALFIIIISIGPWSVYNFPLNRQYNRLILSLEKAGILQNGQIKALNNYNDIDPELSKSIYSQIKYICDYDNCSKIKELFSERYKELEINHKKEEENSLPRKWEIVKDITDYIKVKSNFIKNKDTETEYIHIYRNEKDFDIFPIEVTGYNKIYDLGFKTYPYLKVNIADKNIKIIQDGVSNETINISHIIDDIYNKYIQTKNNEFKKEDLEFIINGKNGEYKLIILEIGIKNPLYKGESLKHYTNIDGYLLTK